MVKHVNVALLADLTASENYLFSVKLFLSLIYVIACVRNIPELSYILKQRHSVSVVSSYIAM